MSNTRIFCIAVMLINMVMQVIVVSVGEKMTISAFDVWFLTGCMAVAFFGDRKHG